MISVVKTSLEDSRKNISLMIPILVKKLKYKEERGNDKKTIIFENEKKSEFFVHEMKDEKYAVALHEPHNVTFTNLDAIDVISIFNIYDKQGIFI